jgi:hypothetical protein
MMPIYVLIVVGVIVGELIVKAIVTALRTKELGEFSTHIFDVLIGAIIYEIAIIDFEFAHYTWIGKLTDHEKFYYFLRYYGLLLIVLGILVMIFKFYARICDISNSAKVRELQE